jgi:hypothetical protein
MDYKLIQKNAEKLEAFVIKKVELSKRPSYRDTIVPFKFALSAIFIDRSKLKGVEVWKLFELDVEKFIDQLLTLTRSDIPKERFYFIETVFDQIISLKKATIHKKKKVKRRLFALDEALTKIKLAMSDDPRENLLFEYFEFERKYAVREMIKALRKDMHRACDRIDSLKGGHGWSGGLKIAMRNLKEILSHRIKAAKPGPIEQFAKRQFEQLTVGKNANLNQFISNASHLTGLNLSEKSVRSHFKKSRTNKMDIPGTKT